MSKVPKILSKQEKERFMSKWITSKTDSVPTIVTPPTPSTPAVDTVTGTVGLLDTTHPNYQPIVTPPTPSTPAVDTVTGTVGPLNTAHPNYQQNLYQSQLAGGTNNPFWQNTGHQIGVDYEGVQNDMITGNAMNAAAIKSRAAQEQAETNARAKTAAQIHQAGFAGTPLGAGAAGAMESELLRNRFDNNLNIEVERQNMRQQGANMAMDYANNVNRFGFDLAQEGRNADLHNQTMWDYAGDNLAKLVMSNPDWLNAYNDAGGDNIKQAALINELRNNPDFNKVMQERFKASGGVGDYDDAFALSQLNAIDSTTNVGRVMGNLFSQIWPEAEYPGLSARMLEAFKNGTLAESFGLEPYKDEETGDFQVRMTDEKEENGKDSVGGLVDSIVTSERKPIALLDLTGDDLTAALKDLEQRGRAKSSSVKYTRRGTNGPSGYDLFDWAYDNDGVVYVQGHPAIITNRTTTGKGWGGGDYRYVYEVIYLDDGSKETFSGEHKSGHVAKYK